MAPPKPALSLRERLRAQLADLKMPGALEALDGILAALDGGTMQAPTALEALLGAQIALRNNRRLEAAMRSSRLPVVKTLAGFDFSFQPSVKREQLESLHTLSFIERKANAVFLGPPGVGKTQRSRSRSPRPRAAAGSTTAPWATSSPRSRRRSRPAGWRSG
jgi:DNA replication protein DnaC